MSAKSKVELSLDEIIKNNKKEQKPGTRNVRRGAGNAKAGQRKSQGVLKRKSIGSKKTSLKRAINKINGGGGGGKQANGTAVNKVATQRLVTKLVKKALKRVTVGKAAKVGAVRNVIRSRRGGLRNRGQTRTVPLNRVSQRSRVIGRQRLNRAPVVASHGRINNRRRVSRRFNEPNPIQSQLAFLRLQQQRQNRNQQRQRPVQVPVIQQPRPIPVQQRRPRVIYMQPPPPARIQPQVIYVQQPPRRFNQSSRGSRRPQRRNNDPFFEPPNFLQRIPAANSQTYGRGRGRGGRFGGF